MLRAKLQELAPRGRVARVTEFKYLLGLANPNSRLTPLLWRVFERQPGLYWPVLRCLQKYAILPASVGDRIFRELKEEPLYAAVRAELLRTAYGRLRRSQIHRLDSYVKANWKPRVLKSADLIAVLGRIAVERGLLNYSQTEYAVLKTEWWVRAELLSCLTDRYIGEPSMLALLYASLSEPNSDVALAATARFADRRTPISSAASPSAAACRVLHAHRLLPAAGLPRCGVTESLNRIAAVSLPPVNWLGLLGKDYSHAEQQAIRCRAAALTDMTKFVNAFDVFNDWVLTGIARHDSEIKYRTGKFGTALDNNKLITKYPAVHALVKDVHSARGRSYLSHAQTEKKRKLTNPTGYIKYRYIYRFRKLLAQAVVELSGRSWT